MGTKIATLFGCPDCAGKIRVPHGDDLPNYCPHCGSCVTEEEKPFVPAAPMIRTTQGISADYTYRKLEADSEARADMARPQIEQQLVEGGIPRDEAHRQAIARANELKVTNMRDNLRDGDIAAMPKPLNNPVTQTVDAYKAAGMNFEYFQGGIAGQSQGPAPRGESGARALEGIQGARGGGRPVANASVAGMTGGFGKVG